MSAYNWFWFPLCRSRNRHWSDYHCGNSGGLANITGEFYWVKERAMTKIYDWFLWIIGFREDENDDDTISDMLWRSKQRMGAWWWLLSLATIIFTLFLLAFEIWLFFHIIFLHPVQRIIKAARRKK